MGQKGKVSVVIPLYNGERYIENTVNNVLGSDYKNIEVLIIDDGSTDNSFAICEQIRQIDDRIVIYRKKNGGVVSARNYGAAVADGEYLCFCDQDDIIDRNCYTKQVERIESDQSDICICSVGRSIDGKVSAFELSDDACYEGSEILEQLVYPILFNGFDVPIAMGSRKRYPHIWSCMFRMSFWRKNNFHFRAYVNFEDDLLVKVQTLANAEKVSTLSMIGYYWRVNLDSESYTQKYIEDISDKQQKCYEDLYTSIADRAGEGIILEWLKKVTFCRQYLEAIHNITSCQKKKNRKIVRDYYHINIYSRDFRECIDASKYVKNGAVKLKIILRILAGEHTMLSYYVEMILDRILMVTLRSNVLTKMERALKGIRIH